MSSECANCKQSLPLDHSGPCPNCGGNVILKKVQDVGIGIDVVASLEATTFELTDEEFDSILRDQLKSYLQDKLGAMKITKGDMTTAIRTVSLKVSKFINDPEFASVAAAYVSLRSQEQQTNLNLRQAELNLKLQRLILYVAIGTLVTGIVTGILSVILAYLYPR